MAKEEMEAVESAAPQGGGKKKLLLLVIILVVVLGGAAAALTFLAPGLVPGLGKKAEKKADAAHAEPAAGKTDAAGPGALYPMKTIIVNLMDPGGKRYLKATLSLEMDREPLKAEVDAKLPQIQDSILILLSSQTYDDISTMEGKTQLRNQIVSRCNTILKTGKIRTVYFSEFVVQ
ncbi:MAG: flagellar basal body-associated FliL family protein [Thermodesulfobacteriota bacterium]